MYNIYYVLSEEEYEAIYVCDSKDNIDKPISKTDVYKIGTLLSNFIKVIKPFCGKKFDVSEQIINGKFKLAYDERMYSYSCAAKNDKNMLNIFTQLISGETTIENGSGLALYDMIKEFLEFIKYCGESKNKVKIDGFRVFMNTLKYKAPMMNYYSDSKDYRHLKDDNSNFAPEISYRTKQIFKVAEPERPQENNTTGFMLETPLYVYKLENSIDFMAAALQCLFERKFFVSRCKYCNDLFVSKNHNSRYCPYENKTSGGCQKFAKGKRQLMRDNASESRRLHKSIRTMLENWFGKANESEYTKFFLDKTKEWRDNIKCGDASEEEYIKWMKAYREKMKAILREQKQAEKSWV